MVLEEWEREGLRLGFGLKPSPSSWQALWVLERAPGCLEGMDCAPAEL